MAVEWFQTAAEAALPISKGFEVALEPELVLELADEEAVKLAAEHLESFSDVVLSRIRKAQIPATSP